MPRRRKFEHLLSDNEKRSICCVGDDAKEESVRKGNLEDMGVMAAEADVTIAMTLGAVGLALVVGLAIDALSGRDQGNTAPASLGAANTSAVAPGASLCHPESPRLTSSQSETPPREGAVSEEREATDGERTMGETCAPHFLGGAR